MFNYENLKKLQDNLKKQAFVPIDAKSAQAAPPGGDPAAEGMPPPGMAPAAEGMPPPGMDPMAMGGDPSGMGLPPPPEGGDVSPDGEPYMKFTPTQLTKFIRQILALSHSECGNGGGGNGGGGGMAGGGVSGGGGVDSNQLAELNAKLDAVLRG